MNNYPKFNADDYPSIYIEETDKDLAQKLNPNFRYAYFKKIAKGGKSIIQSCKDMHLNRIIAHKSLLAEFAEDPIEQKRLLREARVSAMLQHPNTLPIYEVGRNNKGHYYFTMKLVHGYSLREILNYRERYDLSQLLDIIIQVAHALEYAHTHGVIHRDIKPENILIGPFGEVLLMDWGLAKVWSESGDVSVYEEIEPKKGTENASMTGFQKLQGTIFYMSPEQIERAPNISNLTDIYSLGIILYEALTGRTPAQGDTLEKVIKSTLEDQPPQPSELVETLIPKTIEAAAMQCLQKKPDARIQTAAEFINLLQQNHSIR